MADAASGDAILRVDGLKTYYGDKALPVRAVDGVDFSVRRGEILGVVGESGCGKSTLGRTVLRLEARTEGSIDLLGADPFALDKEHLKALRRRVAMVFQDPSSSLNPRKRVDQLLRQPLRVHGADSPERWDAKIERILGEVGISPDYKRRYPHQFSGGQKQRISIARALMMDPEFVVLDEAVSALDVSIQAQILNLLLDLKEKRGLTYLFISHDLSVVEFVSDRILVMYLGRVVEEAPADTIMHRALHPYTQALMKAFPTTDLSRRGSGIEAIEGDVPSPMHPPAGCHFSPRCPMATDECRAAYPALREVAPGHRVACRLYSGPQDNGAVAE